MIIKFLEIIRLAGTIFGYSFGTYIYLSTGSAEKFLLFATPWIVFSIAGLSGIEGLFFSKQAAQATGYETGSNYQKQSAIAMLSYGVLAILIHFAGWGIQAYLTILGALMFFLIFSGINHAYQALANRNFTWKNVARPVLTFLLIVALIKPVLEVL